MSKAGKKILAGMREALSIAKGDQPMMCAACGSGVRSPAWRCDCTKIEGTKHLQRIVPVPPEFLKTSVRGGKGT